LAFVSLTGDRIAELRYVSLRQLTEAIARALCHSEVMQSEVMQLDGFRDLQRQI